MASDNLSPIDRDALVRTVLGEAGNQGPEGQAAIAHVVMNRMVAGGYGSSPTRIVLAPNQFEPWSTRRQELLNINPNSPAYQKAGQIVDAVANGEIPDSTNGATHFLQKETVLQRRGSLPDWASKPVAKIGAHTFYAPNGKASASDAIGAINDAIGETSPSAALGYTDSEPGGTFRAAGFAVPGDSNASPPTSGAGIAPSGSSMFEAAGFKLPGTAAAPPVDTSWQDREAAANLAAIGYQAPPHTGPGRGVVQAIKDYLYGIPQGIIQTAAAPGNILASDKPVTTGELVPTAVGLAGLGEGGLKFGKAGTAAAVEKVGPSAQAVNKMVEAIGPENVPAAVERMQANPRLTPADVSDPVRTMTQGLIDPAQPAAQNAIASAVKARVTSAPDAVNSAYTRSMGPAPDVVHMVEGLKQRARAAGQKEIQPALENAKPVDISPVLSAIDEKLTPGINALMDPKTKLPLSDFQQELVRLKQQLVTDSGEQLFDAQRLHRVQSDLGDQAYQFSKSPNPKDRMLGSQLRGVNEKLIDAIDEASSGAYRPAREKFKDAKDISEAFEAGFDTLKNRQGLTGALEDSPSALSEWIAKATPEEVVARRLGTRADIDQKIRTAQNQALKGEQITRIEYNRDKLRFLFGDQEANRLIRAMEDTRLISHTNAKLLEGAKTAETQAGQRALSVPKLGGGNPLMYVAPIGAELIGQGAGLPGVGLAASVAARGVQLGVQKAAQVNALMRNAEFAKAALATGPDRSILMNKLMTHPKVRKAAGR
jgi:hypothetical protein